MHEIGIMQEAVRMACEAAKTAGHNRVHSLKLRIGSLSGVVPDALDFAFEAVSKGTTAESARLCVETVPAAFWCDHCQTEFEAGEISCECPRCTQPSGKLIRGRELELSTVEMS